MSTTGGTEQGTVYVLDEPDAIGKKFKRAVTDSGREIVRAPTTSPGITNLIEILAVVRGVDARGRSSASSPGSRLRRLQDRRRRARSPTGWRRCASATRSCARTRRRSRTSSRRAPRRRARSPSATVADVREAMGVGPGRARLRPPRRRLASAAVRIAARSSSTSTSSRGRSTCCSSLILREELDLLEVDLAEVVLAYLDHLEARDELDLEAATEFLVLIAALLELKSRLMLPGEEVEELDELEPGRGGRGAARADARVRALPRRRRATWPRAREAEQAVLYRAAAAPAGAAPRAARATPSQAYDPAVLGAALGGLLRTPPPIDLAPHGASPRVARGRAARASCAALLRRGTFSFDDAVARRRPDDRRASPCSRCSSSTSAARPTGSRTSRSGRSPSRGRAAPRRRRRDASRASSRRCSSSRPTRSRSRSSPTRCGVEEDEVDRRRCGELARRARRPRARPARAGRRLDARLAPGRRGGRAAAARPPAHAGADARPGRDAGDRRLPAAGLAPRGRAHPRRGVGVGDVRAGRARADRGGRPLAVRRRALPHDAAVPASCSGWSRSTSCPTPRSGTRARRSRPRCATGCCAPARSGGAPSR